MAKVMIKSEKNPTVTDLIQSTIAAELKRVNLGLERTQVKVSEFEKNIIYPLIHSSKKSTLKTWMVG